MLSLTSNDHLMLKIYDYLRLYLNLMTNTLLCYDGLFYPIDFVSYSYYTLYDLHFLKLWYLRQDYYMS